MIEWNERRLKELVSRMSLKRVSGQGESPIHLSLYGLPYDPQPFLTQVMQLDVKKWRALGYTETDRVSLVQYLGSLGCLTEGALYHAAIHQQPLTLELAKFLVDAGSRDKDSLLYAAIYQHPLPLELAKLLIDAGAFDKGVLRYAAQSQQPLTSELAKLLIDAGAFDNDDDALSRIISFQRPVVFGLAKLLIHAGYDPTAQNGLGWDALVQLASYDHGGHPVDPQVTELFLSAGCRTDLDGCRFVDEEHRLRFDQILKKHAEWEEKRARIVAENSPTGTFYGPDWGR